MIRLLSTRPLDQILLDQAAQKDIRIDCVSFIATEPIHDATLTQQIQKLGAQSLTAVFTSMNAVEAVAGLLGQAAQAGTPAPLADPPSWKIFCIGAATRRLVEEYFGATSIAGTAPSAGALADVIAGHENGLPDLRPPDVFFFCGDQRREELPEKLTTAGIRVHELVVYRTTQTPQLLKDTYDGILFFSPSAVHSFFQVNTLPEKTSLFAIGKTTADTIRTYSNNPVITSDTPEKATLVKQLIDYYEHLEGARPKDNH